MPLPIAHGLIGASIVALSREDFSLRQDWPKLLLGAALAVIPDLDLLFVWVLKSNVTKHGGVSHSILFAVLGGLVGALIAREFSRRGVWIYTAAMLSHALLDAVTKSEFGGPTLFWPVSMLKQRFGLIPYFVYFPDPNTQSLSELVELAVDISYSEILVFAPLFIAAVLFKQWQAKEAMRLR